MGVMHARRVRHSEPPPAPEKHARTQADSSNESNSQLWQVYKTLDLGREYRIEFIEGRIVVSGAPYFWHELVLTWLRDSFRAVREARGWACSGNSDIELQKGELAIRPDLQIIKDPDMVPRLQSEVPSEHVLLVTEVTSKDSRHADRKVKPAGCAKAKIPFYLLVDRFAEPVIITLFSGPGEDGYAKADVVPAGPGGGKLHLPQPFDIILDASTMPMP